MNANLFLETTSICQALSSAGCLVDFRPVQKTSSNHNVSHCLSISSPFVGYSNLPYRKVNFTDDVDLAVKTSDTDYQSDEIMPLTAEFPHNLLPVRESLQGGFHFVYGRRVSRIAAFLSPAKKLLFDILKNLVTFTASNHCMYGGKRYN